MNTPLNGHHCPTREELRYIGIKSKQREIATPSHALLIALSQAQTGLMDAETLYVYAKHVGLEPEWDQSHHNFWVQDPNAGVLLICCELTRSTVH
ncbi:Uncharacterised protein [Pseudomonas luteola]|uniref:Uncharacterized protein n=1 Tax=Pseudomonas luteola TaxID=47886 RepID=A0A2X2C6Q1_PSELU|nr:hypothetical protein [Pseudomonas luteola]SPZ02561.1 Uncharacterised protein [Pseudomonas luteola]